jgi:stearoyl-CoA desaturase (delta-9 desaturase)
MFQSDYRCGIRWWHLDINKWFISVCALLGLARNRKRAPMFKVLRARLNMEFKHARQKLEQAGANPGWIGQLEAEYAQFMATIREWQQLQMDRVQSGRQRIAERIGSETASLAARYHELEKSLTLQRKRLALLTAQVI